MRRLRSHLALTVMLIGPLASPVAAMGATIFPTRTDDPTGSGHCPSNCSLRQAIAFAKPGDTISLVPPAQPGPYVLTQGSLMVSTPLKVVGLGARRSTITAISSAIFTDSQTNLTLSGLDLTGVESGGNVVGADGPDGVLTVQGSSVSVNPGGDGISAASTTVRVVDSTIANISPAGMTTRRSARRGTSPP